MPQTLVHFDESTLQAIDRIAPAAKRKRADFIRSAVKDAIFRQETERMRKEEGLPKVCVANCDNLRVVSKASLVKRAGSLSPERWIEVKRAVGAALGWRELTDLD